MKFRPPTLFETTDPRLVFSHDGRRWGVVVEHGFLRYGRKAEGVVFPVRRFTRRGIRRAGARLLAGYRKSHNRRF